MNNIKDYKDYIIEYAKNVLDVTIERVKSAKDYSRTDLINIEMYDSIEESYNACCALLNKIMNNPVKELETDCAALAKVLKGISDKLYTFESCWNARLPMDMTMVLGHEYTYTEYLTTQYYFLYEDMESIAKRLSKLPAIEPPTPTKQFYDLKAKHPDAVLLFRCGDCLIDHNSKTKYVCFNEDAQQVSNICGIELVSLDDCKYVSSFSWNLLDVFLPKLIRAGKRVAICDQIEKPIKSKKLKV